MQGCAGFGKTFLMQGVAKYLFNKKRQVSLIAPTGKATKVLTKKSGYEATTIHKHIYKFKELEEVVLNIFYNGKGLITNILPHMPGCKDSAFRDEVTVCIVR